MGYLNRKEKDQVIILHAVALYLDHQAKEWQGIKRPAAWYRKARIARTFLRHIADEIMAKGDLPTDEIIKLAHETGKAKLQITTR